MNKNQNEKIKDILNDLYAIDPVLERYEEEIKKTVKELLKSKPEIKIDQEFVIELRGKIMKRIEELQYQPQKKKISFWQAFFGTKFSYALSGILALVLFLGIFFNLAGIKKTSETAKTPFPVKTEKISLGDNAFGSLIAEANQAYDSAEGRGGGGNTPLTETFVDSARASCEGVGCVMPPYYALKYVYKGESMELEASKVEVLRRKSKVEYTRSFAGLLESFGFGLTDLAGFGNTRIQTINLVQDKDFGYSIFINLDEGTISIDAFWPKWPNLQSKCVDERCVTEYSLKLSDVPKDEALISMAKKFVSDHNINLSEYGEPEVDKSWNQVYYAEPLAASQIFVPDVVSVKYPLLIDGKFVYEQGGSKLGVNIGVNIRHKRVSGVYGLSIQEYESSFYEAEKDFAKILMAAEKGGLYNYFMPGEQTKEIEIGTPEHAYGVIWKYDEKTQTSKTLLVPALVFPVYNPSETYFYGFIDKIVIPLAKELLESVDYPVRIMLEAESSQ